MLEIAMLIMGIVVLFRGRMSLSKTKEIRGPIARVVGLIMVAPVPIVVAYAFAKNVDPNDGPFGELFIVEISAVLACFILAMIVAYANADLKEEAGGRSRDRFDRDDDDYDDRERNRRGREDDYYERRSRREREDDFDDRRRDDFDDRAR